MIYAGSVESSESVELDICPSNHIIYSYCHIYNSYTSYTHKVLTYVYSNNIYYIAMRFYFIATNYVYNRTFTEPELWNGVDWTGQCELSFYKLKVTL